MARAPDKSSEEILGIFPTPIMVCRGVVDAALVRTLIEQFDASETGANNRTALLQHTPVTNPHTHANFQAVCERVAAPIQRYGATMLGETLKWGIKEMWMNRMAKDGSQKLHNHANSFISGVLYLTAVSGVSTTMFHRNSGASGFVMDNMNENTTVNEYNAPVFRAPDMSAGDVILFPSYLMHEVPPSPVDGRMSLAFNAIPERIDSWGYRLSFR